MLPMKAFDLDSLADFHVHSPASQCFKGGLVQDVTDQSLRHPTRGDPAVVARKRTATT